MSANNSTQREVIERLSVVLRPAKARVPAAREEPRGSAGHANAGVLGSDLLPGIRTGALQQGYRLYRVCGYGIVSALDYTTRSPNW